MSFADRLRLEMDLQGIGVRELHRRGGPTNKTTQRILDEGWTPGPTTLAKLDKPLGWKPGSAWRLAHQGIDPEPLDAHDPTLDALRDLARSALSTLATLRSVLPEEAKTEAVTTLLDLLREQIEQLAE